MPLWVPLLRLPYSRFHRYFHQMAGSKYQYVKNFELPDPLLPGTFMVYRLDGHSFHR